MIRMNRTVVVVVAAAGLVAALLATWLARWMLVVVPRCSRCSPDESHSSQQLEKFPQLAYSSSTPEPKPWAQEAKPLAQFPLSLPGVSAVDGQLCDWSGGSSHRALAILLPGPSAMQEEAKPLAHSLLSLPGVSAVDGQLCYLIRRFLSPCLGHVASCFEWHATRSQAVAHSPLSLPGPTDSTTTYCGAKTLLSHLQDVHHMAMASQPIRGLLTCLQHAAYSAMVHQALMITALYVAGTVLCALLRWACTCLVQVSTSSLQQLKTGQEREGCCAGSKEKERAVGAVDRELGELKRRLLKLEGEKASAERAAAETVGHLEEAMKEGFAAVRGEVAAVKGGLAVLKQELSAAAGP
ncbi:unnamed protein product [Closterium sp. Yama58-4]|nr:unnamed protein product [Closterium sp. Yama58-4]